MLMETVSAAANDNDGPEITIDPEFAGLIPALLPEEFAQLSVNIVEDGWDMDGNEQLEEPNRQQAA